MVSILNVVTFGTTHYYITNTSLPLAPPGQVFILQNELIKHEVNGYFIHITQETVNEWNKQAPNAGVSSQEFLQEIRNVLFVSDDKHSFEIHGPAMNPEITLWSTKNSRRKLGIAKLNPMSTSEALAALTRISLSVIDERNTNSTESDTKIAELSKSQGSFESKVKKLIVEKNKMEDHMYRAFAKCLNGKKEYIQQLGGEDNQQHVDNGRENLLGTVKKEESDPYNVDTDIEGEEAQPQVVQNRNPSVVNSAPRISTISSSTIPHDKAKLTSAAPLVDEDDDDLTDYEGEIVQHIPQASASAAAVKRKAEKIVAANSDSGTDSEENSPSILGNAKTVPPKRSRARIIESDESN